MKFFNENFKYGYHVRKRYAWLPKSVYYDVYRDKMGYIWFETYYEIICVDWYGKTKSKLKFFKRTRTDLKTVGRSLGLHDDDLECKNYNNLDDFFVRYNKVTDDIYPDLLE